MSPNRSPTLLKVSTGIPQELRSYADLTCYAARLSPTDALLAPWVKIITRLSRQSMMKLIRSASGLSRSQLLRGVTKQSTLKRAERHATNTVRNGLRKKEWTEAEIEAELNALPSARHHMPLPLADLTYGAFKHCGGGTKAVVMAMSIDRLARDLQQIYEEGAPVGSVRHILHAPDVLGANFFSRPETRLTTDPIEQTVIDALGSAESWADANPFVCFLGVHCVLALLAAIDTSITAHLHTDWGMPCDSVISRLLPGLTTNAQTETGRPTRRRTLELPFAKLLEVTVELIYKIRTNRLPKRRILWKDVEAWTSISAGQLAKWRSGETAMSAEDYQNFWNLATNGRCREKHVPPAPMALFLAASIIEASCIAWRRPGRVTSALVIDVNHLRAYRRVAEEAGNSASS